MDILGKGESLVRALAESSSVKGMWADQSLDQGDGSQEAEEEDCQLLRKRSQSMREQQIIEAETALLESDRSSPASILDPDADDDSDDGVLVALPVEEEVDLSLYPDI